MVRANDDLEVVGLAAGSNVEMLEKQIREFHPRLVAVWKEEAARDLAVRVQDLDVKIVSQMGGLIELARMEESDILVTAIVGMIGIRPTMEAILAGKDIALANKETLVTAGHLIMPLAKQFGVQILPVDSEHSAIFQALHGEKREQIHKLLITASAVLPRKETADLEKVTLEDTLKHPNWVMGQKITVDSATLVNKGLEVMEARWLFDCRSGSYSGCGSAAEYYPLYGGIRGRCSDGTAWNTGYETSDTVCIMLPGQKIFKRRQTGFSYVEADHL